MPTEPTGSADDHVSNVLDELDSQSEVTGQPDWASEVDDSPKVDWNNPSRDDVYDLAKAMGRGYGEAQSATDQHHAYQQAMREQHPEPQDTRVHWNGLTWDNEAEFRQYDPDGYRDAVLLVQQQQINNMAAKQEQEAALMDTARSAQEFTQTNPDYPEAVNYVWNSRFLELTGMGYSQEQAAQFIGQEAMQMIQTARASGRNPAEWVHRMAKLRGYDPGEALDRMSDDEVDWYFSLKEEQAKKQGYRPGLKNGR